MLKNNKLNSKVIIFGWLLLSTTVLVSVNRIIQSHDSNSTVISYVVDPTKQDIQLYWKNDQGNNYKSIQNLKNDMEAKNLALVFAMNAGMYKKDNSPQGLFIQHKKTVTAIDTGVGVGNFYMKPNGIFYITTNNSGVICNTKDFVNNKVKFATQSGPLLICNGQIHPSFNKGSSNLNIRNGVGILPNNQILFAMSKSEINFYDFALYFKKMGCKNALYLDGFVSRTYLPEKQWLQLDGDFGVIIGVTKKTF